MVVSGFFWECHVWVIGDHTIAALGFGDDRAMDGDCCSVRMLRVAGESRSEAGIWSLRLVGFILFRLRNNRLDYLRVRKRFQKIHTHTRISILLLQASLNIMSRAAKLTLAGTSAMAAGIVVFVHYAQRSEKAVRSIRFLPRTCALGLTLARLCMLESLET